MTISSRARYKRAQLFIGVLLIVSSLIVLSGSYVIYRNSLHAADESLRLQAIGIAASLEPLLASPSASVNLFTEIISETSWDGIAYISLHSPDGTTLRHSNPSLIGRRIDSEAIRNSASSMRQLTGYTKLGTGEDVFLLDYPVKTAGGTRVIRLALHPFTAEQITSQARLQAAAMAVTLLVIWLIGILFIISLRRSDRLTSLVAEKERLALLGEMSAVLAHEIRNPLGSIKGFAQYLIEKGTGAEELRIIISETERLERLTSDMLLYSRPSDIRPSRVNISLLAANAVHSFSDHTAIRSGAIKLALDCEADIELFSDEDRLRQILSNVISNALDAIPGSGEITVSIKKESSFVSLAVRDNGMGMDKETLDHAFDSFFTTKARGTGLGLAIVSRLALELGAEIDLQSIPDGGTVFSMTISDKLSEGHE